MVTESFREEEKKTIESFVKDGGVDWERWRSLEGKTGSYNDKIKERVLSYLLDIGILSFKREGNHRVTGGEVNLNPSVHIEKTYFTSRESARDYAKVIFGEAQYQISIERLTDIEDIDD